MKIRNLFKNLLSRILMTLAIVAYLPVFSACQSKILSRSQAQKMIIETPDIGKSRRSITLIAI